MDDQCNGDNENEDEYLDKLLPSLTEYCDYIKEQINKKKSKKKF